MKRGRKRLYQRKIQHLTIRYPVELHERANIIAKAMRPPSSLNAFLVVIIEDGILKYEEEMGIDPEKTDDQNPEPPEG